MDIPHFSRKQLTLAILAASVAPATQADFTDTLSSADSESTIAEAGSAAIDNPDMAQDAEGNFIVVWEGDDDNGDPAVLAQRYETDGTKLDSDPLTVTSGSNQHIEPAVAMADNGDAVVTWIERDSSSPTLCGGAPRLRPLDFDESGFQSGTTQPVLKSDPGLDAALCEPDIARDGDGDYVIVYQKGNTGSEIHGRGFGADHQPLYASSSLHGGSSSDSRASPAVATDDNGQFIATWANETINKVYARLYDLATGDPVDNQATSGNSAFRADGDQTNAPSQEDPSVTMNAQGDFLVAWQTTNPDDTSDTGIAAQLFMANASIVSAGRLSHSVDVFTEAVDTAVYGTRSEETFITAWLEAGSPNAVRTQGMTASGDKVPSSPVNINDKEPKDETNARLEGLSVRANTSGDLAASWVDQYSQATLLARSAEGPGFSFPAPNGNDDEDGDGLFGSTGPLALIGGALLLVWRRLAR